MAQSNADRQREYRRRNVTPGRNVTRNAGQTVTPESNVTPGVTVTGTVTPVTECAGCIALRRRVTDLEARMDAQEAGPQPAHAARPRRGAERPLPPNLADPARFYED